MIDIRLLAVDEGRQQLSLVSTKDSIFHWVLDLADFPLARDMQRLDDERVLALEGRVAPGPGRRAHVRRELALQVLQQEVDPQLRTR